MRRLVDVAAPFWAGEAEIVRAHFARPRTLADDLHWLRAQAYKETRHLRILPPALQDEFLRTGRVAAHPEGPEAAKKFAEEMRHFRLLTDLIAELTGRPVTLADLRELPEETRLQDLRAPYRAGPPLDRAIVDFTEGGGGAMYWVLMRLEGGTFERRAAEVFRIIYDDEVIHGPAEIHTIARHAADPGDWTRAEDAVRAICHQRLHMRNEMFLHPLTAARIGEIAAGKIEPWAMPIPL
jgi:hypothetical protein